MGALHDGHLAHLDQATKHAENLIVSIFVNPTQFGPNEDFERYPRTLDVDLAACETHGADAVFIPSAEAMYPPGVPASVIEIPAVAANLESAVRPGHFAGVGRVILKLLNIIEPDLMTLGRKDYQQLCVVRTLLEDLFWPGSILPIDTIREPDGLAMSSRNRYLEPADRSNAVGLIKALRLARQLAADGETDPQVVESIMLDTLRAHQVEPDYAVVRHRRSLADLDYIDANSNVALVAGRVGGVRLIDNLLLDPSAA
jgi:pantoate--beta-alanine ligase